MIDTFSPTAGIYNGYIDGVLIYIIKIAVHMEVGIRSYGSQSLLPRDIHTIHVNEDAWGRLCLCLLVTFHLITGAN